MLSSAECFRASSCPQNESSDWSRLGPTILLTWVTAQCREYKFENGGLLRSAVILDAKMIKDLASEDKI